MCKWGDTVPLEVTILAAGSHTGKERKAVRPIDKCLAPLVKMLNEYGIKTIRGSCCGHGKTKKSGIMIDPRNIHFGKIEESGLMSISLKFPYPGDEKK
ncbi:hypothetical protein ES703_120668 [subsurface metagenome]